jgi:hypothetical protein
MSGGAGVAPPQAARGRVGFLLGGHEEAAQILGVNRARVRQLVATGLLPFKQTPHGYTFRREQLLVVAPARTARFRAYEPARAEGRPKPWLSQLMWLTVVDMLL